MKTLKDVMTRSPIAQYRFSKVGKTCSQFTVTQEIEHPDCTDYGDQKLYIELLETTKRKPPAQNPSSAGDSMEV